MRVGVAQFASGTDKSSNIERLTGLVAAAASEGAELVVAPEAAMHTFGDDDADLAAVAEPTDGPFVTALATAARSNNCVVVAGMFERIEGDAARAYNTVVAVGPDSTLLGRYRKIHLFDALGWTESKRLVPGTVEPTVFQLGELMAGVVTCYDIRFPELGRYLVDRGVDVIVVPSAWVAGPHKVDQWRALVAARAIENTSYVVAAGQPPPEYSGHSMVVDPFGVVLAELGDDDGVTVVDIDRARVREVRERMPSLAHRRLSVVPGEPAS